MATTLSRLDHWIRATVPAVTLIFCVLAGAIVLPLPGGGVVGPSFTLIAVFYWVLRQPERTPMWLVFVIGVFEDLLFGAPLGSTALIFVITHWVVRHQQRLHVAAFGAVWWGFAPYAACAALFHAALAVIEARQPIPIAPVAASIILTFAMFPLLTYPLSRLERLVFGKR